MRELRNLPLSFLPTFEAAGRLGSLKAAASELHLTPSAVSQQMRLLEEALGERLFERRGRGVVLTAEGSRYLFRVRRSLAALADGRLRASGDGAPDVLRLSTPPLVAHTFLLPRLPALRARFPSLRLRIHATTRLVDLETEPVDAAIRVGGGPWPGLAMRAFGRVEAALVCAPELSASIHHLTDLRRQVLLDIQGQQGRTFGPLLRSLGIAAEPGRRWIFESCFDAACAAEHGLGVTYAVFPLITAWTEARRLAVPLPLRVPLGDISLVYRSRDPRGDLFAALASWLEAQFAALPALASGRVAAG